MTSVAPEEHSNSQLGKQRISEARGQREPCGESSAPRRPGAVRPRCPGAATAAFSLINIGFVKPTALPVVITTLLAYGALGQLAVAMWEVLRGNMFGVVAFGTFGCFNLALWYFLVHEAPKIPLAQLPANQALFLAVWAIPAFILWMASFRTNLVINLIFMLATALFIVAAWGNGAGISGLVKASRLDRHRAGRRRMVRLRFGPAQGDLRARDPADPRAEGDARFSTPAPQAPVARRQLTVHRTADRSRGGNTRWASTWQ